MKKILTKLPNWLKYALPIFIIFSIILMAYYPGLLVCDSIVQWDQVQSGVFNNWHPAYNTIYIYLLTRIWNNPFFVLLVQCFILSLSFGVCLSKIEKYYNIKKKYLYVAAIFFAIIPLNFNSAVILLKDTLYSTFILFLASEFLSIANDNEYISKKQNLFKISLYSLIVCLFRHNGILVVILSLLILIIIYHRRLSVYIMTFLTIGIYIFATTIGFSILNITEGNYANKYGPLSHFMAKLLNEKENALTDKELLELEKYVNIEQLKVSFNQYNMDYSINSQNIDYIKDHSNEYIKYVLDKAIKNPLIFIDYYLKLDSYLYSPIPLKNSFTVGMFIDTDLWLYEEKYQDLNENSKLPFLLEPIKFVTKAYQYRIIGVITTRPALYMYASIIMLFFINKWQKNKKIGLIILPAIFNIISLAPAIPVAMTRYVYSMMLTFYMVLVIFLSMLIPKLKNKKENQMIKYIKKIYSDSKESYLKILENDLKNKNRKFIITVNPETLMLSEKDSKIQEMLNDKKSSLTPDGIAIIKAAKKLKINIKERITGIDIANYLLEEANKNKYSLYLFGAKDNVINELKNKIKKEYPNIKLLGATNGYVDNKDEIMDSIIKLEPDIVMLAMGIPLQETLIYKHYKKAKKGIFIGVGGSFDVLSGTKKRAPKLFIKLNLEWLYRIIKEPKRLKRFYQNNIKFLFKIKNSSKN